MIFPGWFGLDMVEQLAEVRVDMEMDALEGEIHCGAVIYVILQRYKGEIDGSQLAPNCI
jgi:phage tail tube protein FII